MTDLSNKVAFVAGARSSIGRACISALRSAGAQICAVGAGDADRNLDVDVYDAESWDEAFDTCVKTLGRLDVLVIPTAGKSSPPIEDAALAGFVSTHRAMVVPAFLAQNRGIVAMRKAGNGGAVVHVIPAAARAGLEGAVAACTASAGILFSSKSASLECAKEKDGIVVNAVLVGPVAGEPQLPYPKDVAAVPPQAVADAVLFYATDGAVYMSGMDLPVDGGFLAG
ncbi:MAG: SDR family oxidoreductase [Rhodospirillaceae bacterium]|nr:SDR family oxidoreductase [Rhodospirillaceae bacterium]MBT5240927.1 SDR family oxidoreductase [Rhodospirillaceae bacterium]MBT5564543.1 SDR family oxidoreductase [Rhodospirillaceae bacterium]MBT6090878.1 SDR family oxidoreductase [Rhodospirillaceae bacterium]